MSDSDEYDFAAAIAALKAAEANHYAGVCPGGVAIHGVCVSDERLGPGAYMTAENKARKAKGLPQLTKAEKNEVQKLSIALENAKSIEEKIKLIDQYAAYGRDTMRLEESLARRLEAAATFEEKYADVLRSAAAQVTPSASPMGVTLPDPTMTAPQPPQQSSAPVGLTGQSVPWYTRPEILASGAAALLLLLS